MASKVKRYFWNILISFDQFVNTIFGGDPDETISSRLGKWHRAGKDSTGLRHVVYQIANAVVELFQKDHFKKSIEEDEGKDETLE